MENRSNSQLCRKIMIPLPDELTDEQAVELARAIIADRVAEGHVIDAAIHCCSAYPGDDPSDRDLRRAEEVRMEAERLGNELHRNIHLHIQEPLREVDEDGFRMAKSECVYLVRDREGREERFSSRELKRELEQGREWEKVFYYNKEQLTKTQAIERGLDPVKDRDRKQAISETRYLNNWNDNDRAEVWREQWASRMNEALERAGINERVDHRSYERQGIEREARIHEGPQVRALEREAQKAALERGEEYEPVTDARQHNRAVEEFNEQVRRADIIRERINELVEHLRDGIDVVIDYGRELLERMQQVRAQLARSFANPREQQRCAVERVMPNPLERQRAQERPERGRELRKETNERTGRRVAAQVRERVRLEQERQRAQERVREPHYQERSISRDRGMSI